MSAFIVCFRDSKKVRKAPGSRTMDFLSDEDRGNLQFEQINLCPPQIPAGEAICTGHVYGVTHNGQLIYIGSSAMALEARMRAYVSSLRCNTTTSPLHRYAAENGHFEDGWAIVPLKHVTYLRSLHPNALTEQEQLCINVYRDRLGCQLLNRNATRDSNDTRRERARAYRLSRGQGTQDPVTGRSMSYHAQYCAAWRQRRREQEVAAQ